MGGRLKKAGGPFGSKKPALPPSSSSPDSVLQRLDEFDLRLRQLEENQVMRQPPPPPSPSPPPAAPPPPPPMHQAAVFSFPLHHHHPQQQQRQQQRQQDEEHQQKRQLQHHSSPSSVPMPSPALGDVDLKGSLMNRLQLLETRILQLSSELEERSSSSGASSSTARRTSSSDSTWALQSSSSTSVAEQLAAVPSSRGFTVAMASTRLGLGERLLHGRMSKLSKAKDPKQVMDAAGKKASDVSKQDKKRMERTRIYKRWFPVGC